MKYSVTSPTEQALMLAEAARECGIHVSNPPIPASRIVEVNSLRYHYLDWGMEALPLIVLLHGGALQAHTWDLASLVLRQHFHVIAPDQRGHGDTEWTPEHLRHRPPYELMLEDTFEFLSRFQQPLLSLVGMSMGGLNAIRFASRFPDAIRTLCIVDIAPEWVARGGEKVQRLQQTITKARTFEEYVDRAHKLFPRRALASLRYSLLHSLKQSDDDSWVWKQDRRPLPNELAANIADHGQANSEFTRSLWDDLRRIEVPTLVIRGGSSPILNESIALRMVDCLRNATLVTIENAGHNVHSDNPIAFADALSNFLMQHVTSDSE